MARVSAGVGTALEPGLKPAPEAATGVQRLWPSPSFRFIIIAGITSRPGGSLRFRSLLCFFFALGATCAAQDSNFPAGPQYLMNFGSSTFLGSIATPSLSLSEAPRASAVAEAGNGVQLSLTQATPQIPINLLRIFYGNAAPQESPASSEPLASDELR